MTVFRKTILGKILGGAGKVLKTAVPIAAGLATGGVATGVLGAASSGGIFSKIKGIFKKKAPGAGTPLGNFINDASQKASEAAAKSLGMTIGSGTSALASEVNTMASGENPSAFAVGAKQGFINTTWSNNKGLFIGAVVFIAGIIIYVIFRKKR
jgi:hypothetical protein